MAGARFPLRDLGEWGSRRYIPVLAFCRGLAGSRMGMAFLLYVRCDTFAVTMIRVGSLAELICFDR